MGRTYSLGTQTMEDLEQWMKLVGPRKLGVTGFAKLDVFLENSQTAFDPPPLPIFGNYIALFFAKICKYALTCVNLQ